MDLQSIVEKIKPTVKNAGDKLADEYNSTFSYEFKVKSKGEIVTKADKYAEEIIIKAIKENFPEHSILSEESGLADKKSDFMWVVDPLDGTTNFAMKNPFFNTSVSLVHQDEIVIGFVYAPLFNEFYYAVKGKGSFMNEKRIEVNKNADMGMSLNAFCYGAGPNAKTNAADYYKRSLEEGYQARQLGAAALELARVGSGILDSMVVPGANPWDVAAGALIVMEAGGIVTDINGNKFELMENNGIIAASSNKILSQVRNLINF